MRSALILTLSLFCVSFSWAQSAAPAQPASTPQKSSAPAEKGGAVEQRAERIHLEDAGSKIDELRVGGETKSIDVKPKGGMPAYQVQPSNGERSWKILGF